MASSTVAKLAAPRNVSPFIRFCRWSFLLTGIAYGHFHYKWLARKERKIQEVDDKIRARRDARLAQEREHANKMEMDALGREAGVLPPTTTTH